MRTQRFRTACEQGLNRVLDGLIEAVLRRDLVDQAPAERGRRVDILRRHDQPARAAPADQPRQQCGMDHRRDPDLDLGHAEMGVVRGNPEIAGSGNFEAAAETPARQPGDHGSRKLAHSFAEIAQPRDEGFCRSGIELRHFLDVGAANHALFTLSGQDDDANARIAGQFLETLADAIGNG